MEYLNDTSRQPMVITTTSEETTIFEIMLESVRHEATVVRIAGGWVRDRVRKLFRVFRLSRLTYLSFVDP